MVGRRKNVVVRNIFTGKEVEIVNASTPAIYGDNLVYVRSKYENGQPAYDQNAEYNSLYLYNLSTNKEVQLIPYTHAQFGTHSQWGSSIYGNKVVYGLANQVNSNEWSTNIFIYDIPTKRVSDISRTGRTGGGKIYGNIVVWIEYKNRLMNVMDVYMRDIAKHETRQVTFDGNPTNPDIYGDRIALEKYTEKEKSGRVTFICTISQPMRQFALQTSLMQENLRFTTIKLYTRIHAIIRNIR